MAGKKKKHHNLRCDALWSGRRGSLAALPCRDTHSGRQTPHRGRFLASLAPCSTLCPLEPKNKGMTYVMPLFFGAGDEARTRYLHLGKVAL
ncbi:MAG: hypothetical protein ACLTZJ_03685, partial [Oscillospiraceae bacterium]